MSLQVGTSNVMPLQVSNSNLNPQHSNLNNDLQLSRLHGSECLLFNYDGESDNIAAWAAVGGGGSDDDVASGDAANGASADVAASAASWLELEGLVTSSPPTARAATARASARISNNSNFESEIRQHLCDLLHYVDDLERQVMSHVSYRMSPVARPYFLIACHMSLVSCIIDDDRTNTIFQVTASQVSISILSKPCAMCTARSHTPDDNDGNAGVFCVRACV